MAKGTGLTEGQIKVLSIAADLLPACGPGPDYQGDFRLCTSAEARDLLDRGLLEVTPIPHKVAPLGEDAAPYLRADHHWRATPAGRAALAERGGADPSPASPVAKDERHG